MSCSVFLMLHWRLTSCTQSLEHGFNYGDLPFVLFLLVLLSLLLRLVRVLLLLLLLFLPFLMCGAEPGVEEGPAHHSLPTDHVIGPVQNNFQRRHTSSTSRSSSRELKEVILHFISVLQPVPDMLFSLQPLITAEPLSV